MVRGDIKIQFYVLFIFLGFCQTSDLGLRLKVDFVFPPSQEQQQEEQQEEPPPKSITSRHTRRLRFGMLT